ncbi:asparaginase [Niveibacterium sp. 24ML]|uniref:asparaginase n=1 Tax=Niveibacterium sp. 24ML TaxID=2985512 RepID=UPI002272271D|nr:asparaginase [Niveibacterium sp. 24ML]MCX9157742.1 asparaginase [Niveibacterium sp. 24ML]
MPHLLLVATGGTIAGSAADSSDTAHYRAAALSAETLLAALPEAASIGSVSAEQLFALDSKNMQPAHWLALAQRLRERIADPAIDGIVLTHGTDTLEETAFFLHLTLPRSKPIVLTAAMRPATARSADGPMNLLQAFACAAQPEAAAHGPLVAAGDRIWRARDCRKRHSHAPDALGGIECGPVASAIGTSIQFEAAAPATAPRFGGALATALPRVDVICAYAGAPADLLEASVERDAKALVLALTGHGSVPDDWLPAIAAARAAGIAVVRASRVMAGGVAPQANFDDAAHGTLVCGRLSPWQARIVLMLGIAQGHDALQLQADLLGA